MWNFRWCNVRRDFSFEWKYFNCQFKASAANELLGRWQLVIENLCFHFHIHHLTINLSTLFSAHPASNLINHVVKSIKTSVIESMHVKKYSMMSHVMNEFFINKLFSFVLLSIFYFCYTCNETPISFIIFEIFEWI